ncbi:MAG: lipid-binding SYLF domain-containing protein [Steroidobacteraceae bacterium]
MKHTYTRRLLVALALLLPLSLHAASRADLDASSKRVLEKLLADVPAAAALNAKAVGVLVFPSITKAGFMIGGQYGEGVLWQKGRPVAYYNTAGASYGLQAGAQQYGYAMFFMNRKSLDSLNATQGFEVGVGPSVVVVDQGMAKSMTSTTVTEDVYAFIFAQKGLMAGIGIQGNKITRINK